MGLECVTDGTCPAIRACDAATSALSEFSDSIPEGVDKNWLAEQGVIIKMRRAAVTATAEVIDCTEAPTETKNPLQCPLPFGMTENTAFGSPEEMRRAAITIHNATKPKGY